MQKLRLRILTTIFCLLYFSKIYLYAQNGIIYSAEIGTYQSTNTEIPFWQRNNRFGVVPPKSGTILFRQTLTSKKDTLKSYFKTNYGIEIATIVGNKSKVIFPEFYLNQKVGNIYLLVGRKKQVHGLVDSTLSSGSMTWSGNALPVPEIQIGIREFQPFFVKWFAFKGHISHGWFGNQDYVKNSFLHQKSLYFRLGKKDSRIKLYSGVLHSVQWAGTPKYDLGNDAFGRLTNGKFPSDWFTFKQVFFPKQAIGDTTLGYGKFDTENRFGNHVGQIDFGGELKLKKATLLAYRQIPVETGRTIGSLSNFDDGLYGICIKNDVRDKPFGKAVFEVLYTLNQYSYLSFISRTLGIQPKDYYNNAFYFNNAQYYDGWSYFRSTLGTPFLIPQREIRTQKKINNDYVFVNNNRLVAFYFGYEGTINSIKLQLRSSFSRNYGAIGLPITPTKQLSHSILIDFPLPKIKGNLKINIAIDQGDLINDNYGTYISYCRTW